MFRASDITTRWQCSYCMLIIKKKERTETWNDLQKYRNLFTKREIKLPDFPFSHAGKCLTLPYCSWRGSRGTALSKPSLIIHILLFFHPNFGWRTWVSPCTLLDTTYGQAAAVNVCYWTWCQREIRDVKFHLQPHSASLTSMWLGQFIPPSFFPDESVHCCDVMQCCQFLAYKSDRLSCVWNLVQM